MVYGTYHDETVEVSVIAKHVRMGAAVLVWVATTLGCSGPDSVMPEDEFARETAEAVRGNFGQPAVGGAAPGDPDSVRGPTSPFPSQKVIPYDASYPNDQGDIVIHSRGNSDKAPPRVTIIYIHGGGWHQGGTDGDANLPKYAFDKGFNFVSVGYRLSDSDNTNKPMTTWKSNRFMYDHVLDCARAIARALKEAPNHNIDPRRIILAGHSAGAHLTALLSSKVQLLSDVGVDPNVVLGALILDTAFYDLVDRYKAVTDLIANAFGILPAFSPGPAANLDYKSQAEGVAKMNQYSPLLYVTAKSRPQAIVNSGPSSETQLGSNYLQALNKAGVKGSSFQAYPGDSAYEHNEVLQAPGNPVDPPKGNKLPAGAPNITTFCDRAIAAWVK
jgi:arylformamidase